MNPFRKAAAAHSAAVDGVYGERLLVQPQRAGGDLTSGGDDPSRPARTITGSVTRRPTLIKREGAGANSDLSVPVAAMRWQVSFAASLGLSLRAGDLVVRLDEPGEPTLRLAEAEPIPGRTIHLADQVS